MENNGHFLNFTKCDMAAFYFLSAFIKQLFTKLYSLIYVWQ